MRHPDAGLSTLITPFTIEPLGIALPADDPLWDAPRLHISAHSSVSVDRYLDAAREAIAAR